MELNNKEIFSKNLAYYMDRKGIDRNTLCSDLNLKYTTVRDWLKGITYPRIGKIELLANYFGVNKSDLIEDKINSSSSQKSEIQQVYDKLHEPRQEKVLGYAHDQLDEQEAEERIIKEKPPEYNNVVAIDDYRETISLPVDGALEAGTGVIQENNLGIDVTFYVDEIPDEDEYDGIAMVVGRSMEPVLYHGDYLFIDSQAKLEISDIGAFQINGKNVVKKYRTDISGTPYLESINDDYDDIYPTEDDDFRLLGVVIDVVRTGK